MFKNARQARTGWTMWNLTAQTRLVLDSFSFIPRTQASPQTWHHSASTVLAVRNLQSPRYRCVYVRIATRKMEKSANTYNRLRYIFLTNKIFLCRLLTWSDVDISAFHSCVVDLRQSFSEWHLLLSACVLVCRRENVGAWIRATTNIKFLVISWCWC
jgi:hypothetical protein